MKLVHPDINHVFSFDSDHVNSLVVEHQTLFLKLAEDIASQMDGNDGNYILSEKDADLPIAKNVELLTQFAPFDINTKSLLSKIVSKLEVFANDDFLEQSTKILADAERLIHDLCFELSLPEVVLEKMSIGSILKASGLKFLNSTHDLSEQLLDYFELSSRFERKKLFFCVNLRSYISDSQMNGFLKICLEHGYHLLLLDSHECERLEMEKRVIVDRDLSVISGEKNLPSHVLT